VYAYKERLGYVITVPLVHKKTFTVLRMIPITVPVNREHFLYIDVRHSVLCLDRARQYYFTMTEDELRKCQLADPGHYMCTHRSQVTTCAHTAARSLRVHTPTHAVIHNHYGIVHSDNTSEEE